MDLNQLSAIILKAYQKLVATVSRVPIQARTQKILAGTGGQVSVADLIAYQIGWGTLLIGWYEAGLKDEMPQMPGDGFTKWDYVGLARHFYAKYNRDQERELEKVVKRIVEIVEAESKTGNLDKLGVWPWCTLPSGKQWPLKKWITVNTSSPYKRATSIITKNFCRPL